MIYQYFWEFRLVYGATHDRMPIFERKRKIEAYE